MSAYDYAKWPTAVPSALLRNFPAAHMELANKFDSAEKTVHIEKITPGAPLVKESPCSAAQNCILFTTNPP